MISMIRHMEEKIPSTNNKVRKKGMTLVEVMAAMAILSILFVGISGFIVNITKIEDKSNTLIKDSAVIKSILAMFYCDVDSSNNIISNTRFQQIKPNVSGESNIIIINFNDLDSLKEQLKGVITETSGDYTVDIKITKVNTNNLYKITANLKNNIKNQSISKIIYINRY